LKSFEHVIPSEVEESRRITFTVAPRGSLLLRFAPLRMTPL